VINVISKIHTHFEVAFQLLEFSEKLMNYEDELCIDRF